MLKQYVNMTQIKDTLIFFFVVSIVCPNLEEFFVFFNEEEHHIKAFFEGYSSIALGASVTLLVITYNIYLIKRFDLRAIVLFACIFRVLSSLVAAY